MGHVREGARGREFEEAIGWLCDAGLASKVARTTKPVNPLLAYEDQHHFKLFVHDVGLLAAMAELDERVLLKSIGVFEEFKGALTEKYVHQQLIASGIERPMYWSPKSGEAELDFVIEHDGSIIPIEVKATINLKSKSMRVYRERFNPSSAWRFSLSGYIEQDELVNVRLFALQSLFQSP